MPATSFRAGWTAACLLCGAVGIAGCSKEKPAPAPPTVEVTAVTIEPRNTPAVFEFVGQTQSSREVEIRARVDGFLERRVYLEGSRVAAGQTLFLMDRKPFEASLQQARGELAQQQARLQVAEANLARVKPLAAQNAVSKRDLDDAIGNEQTTRAAVLAAEGGVRQAELNLSYTTITSPLTGLSSFAKVQDGAYINPSNNLLTTVAQLDPIWVNFSISENEHLRFRDDVGKGLLKITGSDQFDVEVVLADGTTYAERGKISFADPSFSKETGTFLVRATFANPKGTLRPGQFVRVRVQGVERPNAILVPRRAVQQGAKSHFVWVVGVDGKAEQRALAMGDWSGDDWVINQGLRAGEQVVVDGGIRVTPGARLKVSAYRPDRDGSAAPARSAAEPTSVEKAVTAKTGKPAAAPEPKADPRPTSIQASIGELADANAPGVALPAKVHFAFGETALDQAGKRTIARIAAALTGTQERIVVTGYADSRGTAEQNHEVAEKRAKTVLDALVTSGVGRDRIELKQPAEVVGSGDDAEARRVEIRVGAAR